MKKWLTTAAAAAVLYSAAGAAAPIMYVHDSIGRLGTVDVLDGHVNVLGNMGVTMTDIAFDPLGNLFGLSFTGFYSINPTTAAVTFIGPHGISGGNALVFSEDGTLYAAGNTTSSLFTINPSTGASTSLGSMGFWSGGDLAFNGGNFYLADSLSRLILIDLLNPGNSSIVGSFGVSDVFGLATGGNGQLYGVAGTSIFDIDVTTGAASNIRSYSGQGLGVAYGQSFYTEAGAPDPTAVVPEPATLALLAGGMIGLALRRRRRQN